MVYFFAESLIARDSSQRISTWTRNAQLVDTPYGVVDGHERVTFIDFDVVWHFPMQFGVGPSNRGPYKKRRTYTVGHKRINA